MPEGHTIHRYARRHRQVLAGHELEVSSPQGRFTSGAARLDGRRLDDVDAYGKHLFYRFGDETLHVHLGLFGKFRTHRGTPPPPTPGTRLAMRNEQATVYLAGPTVCELLDPDREDALRSRLGPDPLATPRRSRAFTAALARRRIPIAAALLDQRVIAGIGNVYRAEILFLCGIDPQRPAADITADEAACVWATARRLLRAGLAENRIVTVTTRYVGVRRRADIPRHERLYVYKRAGRPCRRCGTVVVAGEAGGRKVWSCPTCQPR